MSKCWCQREANGEATTQLWDLRVPTHPSAARPKLITYEQEIHITREKVATPKTTDARRSHGAYLPTPQESRARRNQIWLKPTAYPFCWSLLKHTNLARKFIIESLSLRNNILERSQPHPKSLRVSDCPLSKLRNLAGKLHYKVPEILVSPISESPKSHIRRDRNRILKP